MSRPLVIGLGNRLRGDDAAGPQVVDRLRNSLKNCLDFADSPADNLSLIDLWQQRPAVWIIDAFDAGDEAAGRIVQINSLESSGQSQLSSLRPAQSSHALDLKQALELSAVLGTLPQTITLYAIAGRHFVHGQAPSPPVQKAVTQLARQLTTQLARPLKPTAAEQRHA